MSDKELIIKSLQKADRRLRTNRLLGELALGISISLIVPLLFKTWDLFLPFRGRTVAVFLTIWLLSVVAYAVWRMSKRTTLDHIAAAIDHKASLQDEMKSAYWFLSHLTTVHKSSEWVELQVRRAAHRATSMNLDSLFPRVVPSTSYLAGGLFLLLIGLNFIPLSLNHNWLYMQAAPAFTLTPDEQRLISETKKLLKEAQKLDQSELAGKLEQIVQDLEQGNIDTGEAMKQLEELKNILGEGNLDAANINEGLDEMAQDLGASAEAKDVADAMASHDLKAASEELKKLAEDMLKQDEQSQKSLQEALEQASENSNQAMQTLAQDMKNASAAIARNDQKAAQDALSKASQDAQDLQQKLQDQQAKNSASQDIQNLQDSLRQRQQGGQSAQQAQGQKGAGQQQGKQQAQQKDSDSSSADPDEGGEGGSPSGESSEGAKEGDQAGQPGDQSKAGAAGKGQNPSGAGNAPLNIMGAPTQLNVKLEQEKLTSENDGGTPQNIEEASKQERSKLDYRNVHSDLSPAQKDVLNQDKIPWELKGLIKNYFEAIRPPRGKP